MSTEFLDIEMSPKLVANDGTETNLDGEYLRHQL